MGNRIGKKLYVNENVYDLAIARIHRAYDLFDTVALMFSGGKDSTACLNLLLQVAAERTTKKTIIHFFDEEAIPFETEHYVRRVAQLPNVDLKWWCIPIACRNACSVKSPFWYPWDEIDKAKWVRPLPAEANRNLPGYPTDPAGRMTIANANGFLFDPKRHGRVGLVMGIRSDESINRMRAILMGRHREDVHIIKNFDGTAQGNIYKVYPIYDWSVGDVWTAPRKFGWDYNRVYDIMDKAGISPSEQRCAPPFAEEPVRGLYQFKSLFPDIWEPMQYRVPGARAASRYSKTVLYSYRTTPAKPDGVSWDKFIASWVNKHKEPYRSRVMHRIQIFIKQHNSRTPEPIQFKSPHPKSGISWEFLMKIAVRGDYKRRRMPKQPTTAAEAIAMRKRYNAERYAAPSNL